MGYLGQAVLRQLSTSLPRVFLKIEASFLHCITSQLSTDHSGRR